MATALRWVSWEQYGDAEHEPDGRPMTWPPPKEVLAFWETGYGGGEGADAFVNVVALVRAPSAAAAREIITSAWQPGMGSWRFNRAYAEKTPEDQPPGDRFPPPSWALHLKRWPWPKAAA